MYRDRHHPVLNRMAEPTGLEPATSDVTGRRSNQLNYDSALKLQFSLSDLGFSPHR
jgi:hypothetical protein